MSQYSNEVFLNANLFEHPFKKLYGSIRMAHETSHNADLQDNAEQKLKYYELKIA